MTFGENNKVFYAQDSSGEVWEYRSWEIVVRRYDSAFLYFVHAYRSSFYESCDCLAAFANVEEAFAYAEALEFVNPRRPDEVQVPC